MRRKQILTIVNLRMIVEKFFYTVGEKKTANFIFRKFIFVKVVFVL